MLCNCEEVKTSSKLLVSTGEILELALAYIEPGVGYLSPRGMG